MTFNNGTYFATEIGNRIANRWTAAQIFPYLNEALGIIGAAGSFIWDQVEEIGVTPTAGKYTPLFLPWDIGKKTTLLNSSSKTPISKVPQEEYALAAAGYVDQVANEYNAFKIVYNVSGPLLQLYPASTTAAIDLYYHFAPVVLGPLAGPTVKWDLPFMDSVLLDMTEGMCKRILTWADWQEREATGKAKLLEAVKIYSTDRINTGSAQETVNAVQEKTQIGRA